MTNILIIDDDIKIGQMLVQLTNSLGYEASEAHTLEEGFEKALIGNFDLIFLDLQFPKGNGLQFLPELLKMPSEPEIIIITGSGIKGAEIAFKYGAWDYVKKPFLLPEISLPLARALRYREEKLAAKIPVLMKRLGIIGESATLSRCLNAAGKASATDASVLITGETGTGKEMFANAIHENSKRSGKPFVVVDCGALPETLAEGILFGHEKGAFTGADKQRKGLLAQADGGTLFLDEIGELPLNIQKAFLRVLQEKKVRPLGSTHEIPVDFRVVAATNRDLGKMVANAQFREDLLFRIRAIEIQLPALRERREDIREITVQMLNHLCRQYGMGVKGISQEFFEVLYHQEWPGNVRELNNVLEHALAAAVQDPTLVPKHIPFQYRTSFLKEGEIDIDPNSGFVGDIMEESNVKLPSLVEFRESYEKKYLRLLVNEAQGDRKKALSLSGMSQSQLYALLKKYGITGFRN